MWGSRWGYTSKVNAALAGAPNRQLLNTRCMIGHSRSVSVVHRCCWMQLVGAEVHIKMRCSPILLDEPEIYSA